MLHNIPYLLYIFFLQISSIFAKKICFFKKTLKCAEITKYFVQFFLISFKNISKKAIDEKGILLYNINGVFCLVTGYSNGERRE